MEKQMHADPHIHADRHMAAVLGYSEAIERERAKLRADFAAGCAKADLDATYFWAPVVKRKNALGHVVQRAQTFSEVLYDALDSDDMQARVQRVLLDAANGLPVADRARELLRVAGEKWADQNAEVGE